MIDSSSDRMGGEPVVVGDLLDGILATAERRVAVRDSEVGALEALFDLEAVSS